MTKQKIDSLLSKVKNEFLENEALLLTISANERSLTHKFAEYLQSAIGTSFSVDCEYNRHGFNSKRVIVPILEAIGECASTCETDAKTVFPDIIIHKRGSDTDNLLVIEAKKNASELARRNDIKKLKIIKNEYKYSFAVFINFLTNRHGMTIEYV